MTKLLGADISFYQDDPATKSKSPNFNQMKSNGISFCFIRAGQNNWTDRDFYMNWNNSKGVMPRGAYWYYDNRLEPKSQAQKWSSVMRDAGDLGELPLMCDFEDRLHVGYDGWKNWYLFITKLQENFPDKKIGVYTGYSYWTERTVQAGISSASLEWFKKFPLWIARYKAESPIVPKPWTYWSFWQFTDEGDGTLFGVESREIDLNYFNGTEAEFLIRYGGKPTPQKLSKVSLKYSDKIIEYIQKEKL